MNIYDRIACETNSYAELVQREKGDRWSNTSLPESCAFTWLNILMGDSLHYSYEEYWRDNDFLGSPVFKNIMTYSRYEKLSQYIHLNAAAARERPDNANYNPVTKVKPFYDVTNQNFWRYYQHSTEISINKAMKRVHRKTWASPEKFGINFWARCDCRTSYMYMFQLYTGNVTGPPPPRPFSSNMALNTELDKITMSTMTGSSLDGFGYRSSTGRYLQLCVTLNPNR